MIDMHSLRTGLPTATDSVHSLNRALRALAGALLLLLCLSACDGGIFGTGDGGDVILPDDVEGSDSSNGSGDGTAGADQGQTDGGETADPDDGEDAASGDGADLQARAFENLQVASNRDAPLLSMINLSQSSVTVVADSGTAALFDPAVQSGQVASPVDVPLASEALRVIETDGNTAQWLLSPLNLGASSVSTLIIRDAVADNPADSSSDEPDALTTRLDVLALPSRLLPDSDGLVRVRLLQAYAIDGDERAAEMMLLPAGETPGGGEVSLGSVSPAGFQQAPAYREEMAGRYELRDSLQRFAAVPLTLDAGQSYTLIITGSESVLRVVLDSNSGN